MPWPRRLPLIAILRGIRAEEVLAHAQALVACGFEAIEVPLNSPDWQRSIALLAQSCEPSVLVGAGTVLQLRDVDAVREAGGRLIVTPDTRPALIHHAVAQGMSVAAGFATATEAFAAIEAGAQALKLFPAGTYGPAHVKALRAVLPDVPIWAVGGVTPSNLGEWLRAGCSGAAIGSDLYRPGQSPDDTASRARAFVATFERERAA